MPVVGLFDQQAGQISGRFSQEVLIGGHFGESLAHLIASIIQPGVESCPVAVVDFNQDNRTCSDQGFGKTG